MRADHSTRVPEDEFNEIYTETIDELCRREDFSIKVQSDAVELLEDVAPEVKQHYQPKHMAAAAVHIAARLNDEPRTVKQLAADLEDMDTFHVDSSHVTKTRRATKKLKEVHDLDPDPVLAEDYLPQLIHQLDLSDEVEEVCRDLLDRIREDYLGSGRSQIAVASAATYLATKKQNSLSTVDPGELAEVACREKKTIRDNARLFREKLGLDVES